MSEQLSVVQPVTITIESRSVEKMLEKDICNTKWRIIGRGSNPSEGTVTFNSDYKITNKKAPIAESKWEYVGPNQIKFEYEEPFVVFFNKKSLVGMHAGDIKFIGERGF